MHVSAVRKKTVPVPVDDEMRTERVTEKDIPDRDILFLVRGRLDWFDQCMSFYCYPAIISCILNYCILIFQYTQSVTNRNWHSCIKRMHFLPFDFIFEFPTIAFHIGLYAQL